MKETRRYWKLKEETLDCTVWTTRFRRGYGPIVRQTTEFSGLEQVGFISFMKPACSNPENEILCFKILSNKFTGSFVFTVVNRMYIYNFRKQYFVQ